jgi:hypothetical protein
LVGPFYLFVFVFLFADFFMSLSTIFDITITQIDDPDWTPNTESRRSTHTLAHRRGDEDIHDDVVVDKEGPPCQRLTRTQQRKIASLQPIEILSSDDDDDDDENNNSSQDDDPNISKVCTFAFSS